MCVLYHHKLCNYSTEILPQYNFFNKVFLLTAIGSSIMFASKVLFVSINKYFEIFSLEVCYLLVHIVIFYLSWLYHNNVSFKEKKDHTNFVRFFKANIMLKILDYLLVILIASLSSFHPSIFLILSSLLIFILRYSVLKKIVFK